MLRVARGLLVTVGFALVTSLGWAREDVESRAVDKKASMAVPGAIGVSRRPQYGPCPELELSGAAQHEIQPVEISGPVGMEVAIETAAGWSPLKAAPLRIGLVVGRPYRLRLGGTAIEDGQELFPSICVCAKLATPAGTAWRFPVEIQIDPSDISEALKGGHVQRVIYAPHDCGRPDILPASWFDASPGDDCFEVAATLGDPLAELLIGNRLPAPGVVP